MILDHYNLHEDPFGATPDSRYLFESDTHREALASLLLGIEAGRGFFALIAKPGMGKTTLLFRVLSQLKGKATTVFLFQTTPTPLDFMRALLLDLGVQQVNGNLVELQAKLTKILLTQFHLGKRLVVVIDEAQKLDESVLEFIRMLSNFETSKEKLIQIILSGQPELARKLASPNLVQLRQRISIVAQLRPFEYRQTAAYIEHRLRVAGSNPKQKLFSPTALRLIAEHSEGIPRIINNLCFNSMSIGCALRRTTIDSKIVQEVIADLDLDPLVISESSYERANSRCANARATNSPPRIGARLPWALIVSVLLFALSGMSAQQGDGKRSPAYIVASNKGTPPTMTTVPDSKLSNISGVPRSSSSPIAKKKPPIMPARVSVISTKQPPGPVRIIVVTLGTTLSQICAENLNACRPRDIREIQRLNPWLTNPNHLVSGRRLRIPKRDRNSISAAQTPVNSYSTRPTNTATDQRVQDSNQATE